MSNPLPNGIPHEQLAALSHEFRTPLNGVIGMARLLEGTKLTAEQRAYVAALTESGEHLLGVVQDGREPRRPWRGRPGCGRSASCSAPGPTRKASRSGGRATRASSRSSPTKGGFAKS